MLHCLAMLFPGHCTSYSHVRLVCNPDSASCSCTHTAMVWVAALASTPLRCSASQQGELCCSILPLGVVQQIYNHDAARYSDHTKQRMLSEFAIMQRCAASPHIVDAFVAGTVNHDGSSLPAILMEYAALGDVEQAFLANPGALDQPWGLAGQQVDSSVGASLSWAATGLPLSVDAMNWAGVGLVLKYCPLATS